MFGHLRRLLLGMLAILGAESVAASPVGIMFERIVDSTVDELSLSTYPTFDHLLAGIPATSEFSQINVHGDFNTTGLTWDGTRYVLMFERIADSTVDELSFSTYPTFDHLLAGIPATSEFSQINVHGDFNTTGLTWDGTRYVLMFERIVDSTVDELSFSTYLTFDHLLAGIPATSAFSQINVHGDFNTTGLHWDGSQYLLMFERIDDSLVDELSFAAYSTFDQLLAGIPATSAFSQINVHGDFNTTGLFGLPPTGGGQPIPLPSTLWLLTAALGAMTAIGRRRRTTGSMGLP